MLTKKQKQLIKMCWDKGIVHHHDVRMVYSDKRAGDSCIERLMLLKILKYDRDRFYIDKQKYAILEEL